MTHRNQLMIGAALLAGLLSLSLAPAFAAQTVAACEAQWKANKPTIQASGKKKKDFMVECRGPGPAAAAPARNAPPSANAGISAKSCNEQWKANKPAIQASGKTKKVFVSECRNGGPIAAAPAKPAPPAAAPSNEAKTSTPKTSTPATSHPSASGKPATTPTTAGTPTGANQYATEGAARLRCPLDTVVWVNLNSGIYHFNGKKDYGATRRGSYMCEKDTAAAGFRAAKNEKHPS